MESTRLQRNWNSLPNIRIPKSDVADSVDNEIEQETKHVALPHSNISHYHQAFYELGLIGIGKFGSVYKCINRLDGNIYAIKRSIKLVAGNINNNRNIMREVYSCYCKLNHQYLVQYYSAWMEGNHMIIQTEYCNGGSLAKQITHIRMQKKYLSKSALQLLLLHVAEGLRYIHSYSLVHMDIKPGCIFICRQKCSVLNYSADSADQNFAAKEIIYKIGNIGHATSIRRPRVEKGDCRYLPMEILCNDFTNLEKADIFALGLTIYEACGGGPLPKDGHAWDKIRQGKLKRLARCNFNDLLKLMIHPNPEMRPSAEFLIQRMLCHNDKTETQLRWELNGAKLKNQTLLKQLQQMAKCSKTIAPNFAVMNNTINAGVTNVALPYSNASHYQAFSELGLIGTGKFGSVYKCINPVDLCMYAIKKCIKVRVNSVYEKHVLNEISAHAVLRHQHIVHYCSAWMEDNRMIIQKEYCNGGSLADKISHMQKKNKHFNEPALRRLLLHMAKGLKYIHTMQLAHMNIKPDSIFICQPKHYINLNRDYDCDDFFTEEVIYKIGSLGHMTSINNPQVEQDDLRYLSMEILHNDFTQLPKADIFALGLTVYEADHNRSLLKDMYTWARSRHGDVKQLVTYYSYDFRNLLELMIQPNPEIRPSAESLIQRILCNDVFYRKDKTKAQLRWELNMMKLKNEILSKQLQQTEKCSKTIVPNITVTNNTMNARVTNCDRHLLEHSPASWAARSFIVTILQIFKSFLYHICICIYSAGFSNIGVLGKIIVAPIQCFKEFFLYVYRTYVYRKEK